MKVLVTGATGFIGSRLVGELTADGNEVTCLVRKTSNLRWIGNEGVTLLSGDVTDPASLAGLSRIPFDYVYHVAGRVRGRTKDDFFRTNVEGTTHLLDAIASGPRRPKRIVLISSLAAAGPCEGDRPVCEADPVNPVGFYGQSKCAMEERARGYGDRLPITIVRPPSVYGPRDEMTLVVFKMVARRLVPMVGGFDKPLSFVFVDDLVRGMREAALADETVGGTYFLTDGAVYAYRDVISLIERCLERRALKITVPRLLARGAAAVSENLFGDDVFTKDRVDLFSCPGWVCSGDAASRDFGFSTRISLADGIERTVRWYRETGWI
jgi:dihydroflavonol-4-reductase